MNCPEAQSRLSAYYDGQVSDADRSRIDAHLHACADCASTFGDFQALTDLVRRAPTPEPPPQLWDRIEEQLTRSPVAKPETATVKPVSQPAVARRRAVVLSPLVAAVVAILAVGIGLSTAHRDEHRFKDLTGEFNEYLDAYAENPAEAVRSLFAEYPGIEVDFDEAKRRIGYRPVVANSLPAGYSIHSVQLMKMPCCDCIKTVCLNDQGLSFLIFEHDDEQAAWFGNRATRRCTCGGMPTTVIDFNGQIAVTWTLGKRSVTVIGATDVDEIARLMPYLGKEPANG